MLDRKPVVLFRIGEHFSILPNRLSVGPPEAGQRPTRQRFSRIPFALSVVDQAIAGESQVEPFEQIGGQPFFVGADGCGLPLFPIHVVNRDESWFAAHGQPHVTDVQQLIDSMSYRFDGFPLFRGVGFGDAGIFVNPGDRHLVAEFDFAFTDRTGDGCSRIGFGGAGDRDVAFTGQ